MRRRMHTMTLRERRPAARFTLLALSLTIMVSSWLLFQVQPIVAKRILPWFGGAPAVWTTCMLFFQGLLLAGYAYAYTLVTYLSLRRQVLVHTLLLLGSLATLPILPRASWQAPGPGDPTWPIVTLLGSTVGAPYFLLAATAPLMQGWFAQGALGPSPYWLYAVSNASALLALVTYPMLVESALSQTAQAVWWSAGYGVFVLLGGIAGWRVTRLPVATVHYNTRGEADPAPTLGDYGRWFAWPCTATVLLLAVTNELCQNTAVIPFLWVLPLSLYLLTYILCFASTRWYHRWLYLPLVVASVFLVTQTSFVLLPEDADIRVDIAFWSLALFCTCMVCHGELSRARPAPRFLTAYYLVIALAGACGGLFVAVLAPCVFDSFAELPVGVLLLFVLMLLTLLTEARGQTRRTRLLYGLTTVLYIVAITGGWLYVAWESEEDDTIIARTRNFYGVLKVTEAEGEEPPHERLRSLKHGGMLHGAQYRTDARAMTPLTYYGRGSGIAYAFQALQHKPALRIGVVGLGAGTIAAYGRATDTVRFYEINPRMILIAQKYFTFLTKSPATITLVEGDARLSLARETAQPFDLLVLDAFNGDAIPTHLLTQEAFAIYLRHLAPGGMIAALIASDYFDLTPVLRGIVHVFHLHGVRVTSEEDEALALSSTTWIVLSRRAEVFQKGKLRERGEPLETSERVEYWTDDYSNLFRLLGSPEPMSHN
jgi:spermidine synthase